MKIGRSQSLSLFSLLLLGACATTPLGPTVQVMPAPNEPFPVFQQDQTQCKQYAQSQVAGQANAANSQAFGGALLATALGTATGGAVGGSGGAEVGSAAGADVGAAGAVGATQNAQDSIQQNYNNAYLQCMYSHGNQVPGATASAQ